MLIDVDTILQEDKLWYYFPWKVSRTPGGAEVKIDETTRQKYPVRSPKGPCTYEGWLYTGSFGGSDRVFYDASSHQSWLLLLPESETLSEESNTRVCLLGGWYRRQSTVVRWYTTLFLVFFLAHNHFHGVEWRKFENFLFPLGNEMFRSYDERVSFRQWPTKVLALQTTRVTRRGGLDLCTESMHVKRRERKIRRDIWHFLCCQGGNNNFQLCCFVVVSADSRCLFGRLLGKQDSMDVGQDPTGSDGNRSQQAVQLFIILDGKSDVTGYNTRLLVITGGISCKFQDFGAQVFQDSGKVNRSSCTHTSGILALAQVSFDTTDGELQTSLGRRSGGLLFSTASFSFSRHDYSTVVLFLLNFAMCKFCEPTLFFLKKFGCVRACPPRPKNKRTTDRGAQTKKLARCRNLRNCILVSQTEAGADMTLALQKRMGFGSEFEHQPKIP